MKNLLNIFLVAGILLSTNAFSQKRILNKDYTLSKETNKLALIPINYTDAKMSDELLGNVFKSKNEKIKNIEPSLCREILDSDTLLTSYINKIILMDYKFRHLKKFPNLSTVLDPEEIDYIKTHILEADLLLIPLTFNINEMGITPRAFTEGESNFRLYDLNSGDFIFEFGHRLTFPKAGYEGRRGMTTALLIVTQKYFEDHLILPKQK